MRDVFPILLADVAFHERIIFPFVLMVVMFGVSAIAIAGNALIIRRRKRAGIEWLQSTGNRVETAEWVLYTGAITWRRYTAFEIRFADRGGAQHHAFIEVPAIGDPWLLEDKTQ